LTATPAKNFSQKLWTIPDCLLTKLLLLLLSIVFQFFSLDSPLNAAVQNREQCEKCCKSKGYDDYYFEQCRLKCFRSPDHCMEHQQQKPPANDSSERPSPQRGDAVQPDSGRIGREPSVARPPTGPQDSPRQIAPPPQDIPRQSPQPPTARQPKPKRPAANFVWPETLTMVPGKELDAAAQILMANGMSPQHPNFQTALRGIEGILVDFARNNPQGGQLPTEPIERVLLQFR
jgi:hypothetical protein